MPQKFNTILSEISDQYSTLKPYLIPSESMYDEDQYGCSDKKQWTELMRVSKHEFSSMDFRILPRRVENYQMMFVEFNCEQNQPLNEFITANYTEISEFCLDHLYNQFFSINGAVSRINVEQVKYFRPFLPTPEDFAPENFAVGVMESYWYDPFKKVLNITDEPVRGIVAFRDDYLLYFRIDGQSEAQMIHNFVRTLFLITPQAYPTYNAVRDYQPCFDDRYADDDCEDTFNKLLEETREKIARMESMGIERQMIIALLDDDPYNRRLSKLVVTSDFRILLPDYNNTEIIMPPLAKTLYIFYLKHPEGLLFRDLRYCRQDLFDLYKAISKRENYIEMARSIDMLVDSTENSVNENRSRIRSAFLKEFCESIASKYYISGYGRDTPKLILLDRSKVTFQSNDNDQKAKFSIKSIRNIKLFKK